MKVAASTPLGLFLFAALLVSLPDAALAAELEVSAQASDLRAQVGDTISVEVRAVASKDGDVAIELPPLEGLSIVGRSEGTQMSMSWTSAGQTVRREKILRLSLSVDADGVRVIPPITARLGTTTAKTQPIQIQVAKEAPPPSAVAPKAGEVLPPGPGDERVFVRYRLDRSEVYMGEQVILELELIAEPGLSFQIDSIPEPPDLDGFWREVLERPQRLTPRFIYVDGHRYQAYRAWRLALFPLQAGPRTLEPIAIDVSVGGGGLFGRSQRMRRRARALELNVLPLPTEGRPAGFSPSNVGNYALSAKVDQRKVEGGKGVLLTLALSGVGNVRSAKLPELSAVEGFRVFPPTVSDEVQLTPGGVRGTKSAEILLVPTQNGRLELPAIELPVFDPRAKRYEVLKTQPIAIEVSGATAPSTPVPSPTPKVSPDAEAARPPLRFRAELSRPSAQPWRSPGWWALLAAGPLLLTGSATASALRRRRAAGSPTRHLAELARSARTRAAEGRAAAQSGDLRTAAQSMTEAFYLKARATHQLDLRGLTTTELASSLEASGAEPSVARKIREGMDLANYAQFAPSALGTSPEAALAAWEQMLDGLEGWGGRP